MKYYIGAWHSDSITGYAPLTTLQGVKNIIYRVWAHGPIGWAKFRFDLEPKWPQVKNDKIREREKIITKEPCAAC